MIAYATVGVLDLAASAAFYDAVMEALGSVRLGLARLWSHPLSRLSARSGRQQDFRRLLRARLIFGE